MRLTVLAAGVGTRLRPLTEQRPKCLIELSGRTILARLLSQAEETGLFSETVVVSGFRNELLEAVARSWSGAHAMPVRCVRNPDFEVTNTLVSASLGVAGVAGRCVIVDGDLVLDWRIVERVAECGRSALAVDSSRNLDAEAMKCRLAEDGRLQAISKDVTAASAQSESIGLCSLSERDVAWFGRVAADLIASGRVCDYYESAFELMLGDGWQPDLLDVAGFGWEEVDDHDDLRRAAALVADDVRCAVQGAGVLPAASVDNQGAQAMAASAQPESPGSIR